MSRPRQRRGVTYSCVHLEFYPIIIFYEIVLEIEPLLGIVQMFTHVGNLIKLYGAACLLYKFLVSYYLLLIHFPSKSKIMCALSLIFEPVSVFFQFISFYIIKQLFN